MVPNISVTCMVISLIIAVGLPFYIFIKWRKKFELKIYPALVGVAAFMVFALILEQMLHSAVLRANPLSGVPVLLENSSAMYVLYAILAAGIFEESARFLSFKFMQKKFHGFGTALSYGIGHGGIEAIILVGFANAGNIAFSIMANSGMITELGGVEAVAETAALLASPAPYLYLVGGIERIFAITLHISLSVLVWYSATRPGYIRLYPIAILLHALFNLPAALMQAGIIQSLLLSESLIALGAAAIAMLAYKTYKQLGDDEEIITDAV